MAKSETHSIEHGELMSHSQCPSAPFEWGEFAECRRRTTCNRNVRGLGRFFYSGFPKETNELKFRLRFCVCYLRMQMQTLCRAVEILITTSCSTSVKIFYSSLTAVFIASPFCDQGHEGQVKRNHLS